MTNTRDIVLKLKAVRDEKNLSYTEILKLMEKNGDFLSKSTLSRVFAEGSEEMSFKYEETIRPIAKALLDIETIDTDDTNDVRAMKSLLKYKIQRIEELESQIAKLESNLDKEKIRSQEKFEKERILYNEQIEFLTSQIEIKDKRMNEMKEQFNKKDEQYMFLVNKLLNCHQCTMGENK